MKRIILPLWAGIKAALRGVYVLLFIITSVVLFVLHTLWEFKLNFSFFGSATNSFLKGLSYSEYTNEYYYQTPKSLWDFIWNGLKEIENG